jgi:hypothetical protein
VTIHLVLQPPDISGVFVPISVMESGYSIGSEVRNEKGDGANLPERPGGCFAQISSVPFFVAHFVNITLATNLFPGSEDFNAGTKPQSGGTNSDRVGD